MDFLFEALDEDETRLVAAGTVPIWLQRAAAKAIEWCEVDDATGYAKAWSAGIDGRQAQAQVDASGGRQSRRRGRASARRKRPRVDAGGSQAVREKRR